MILNKTTPKNCPYCNSELDIIYCAEYDHFYAHEYKNFLLFEIYVNDEKFVFQKNDDNSLWKCNNFENKIFISFDELKEFIKKLQLLG